MSESFKNKFGSLPICLFVHDCISLYTFIFQMLIFADKQVYSFEWLLCMCPWQCYSLLIHPRTCRVRGKRRREEEGKFQLDFHFYIWVKLVRRSQKSEWFPVHPMQFMFFSNKAKSYSFLFFSLQLPIHR